MGLFLDIGVTFDEPNQQSKAKQSKVKQTKAKQSKTAKEKRYCDALNTARGRGSLDGCSYRYCMFSRYTGYGL